MLALNFKHNFNPVRKVILFPIFLTKCLFFVFCFYLSPIYYEERGGEGRGREKGEEVSRKEGCREEGMIEGGW